MPLTRTSVRFLVISTGAAPSTGAFRGEYYNAIPSVISKRVIAQFHVLGQTMRKPQDLSEQVIRIWDLQNLSASFQCARLVAEQKDEYIFLKIYIDHVPYLARFTHLTEHVIKLHEALKSLPEDVRSRDPGAIAVLKFHKPLGFIGYQSKKLLVFEWHTAMDRDFRPSDEQDLLRQRLFWHSLGFVNLDLDVSSVVLTSHNAFFGNTDCLCSIGKAFLGAVPPESTQQVLDGDPVTLEDELPLWTALKNSMFPTVPDTPRGPSSRSESPTSMNSLSSPSDSAASPIVEAKVGSPGTELEFAL